jgi:ankyrin repeat protein
VDTDRYFAAIREGQVDALRELVTREPALLGATTGPDYAPERPLGCTGLHVAVHADRPDAAEVLLEAGADVEARTTEGRTPLHDSIELGRVEITRKLLERGAVIDVCSAAILGRVERLRELIDADPELVNDRSTQLSPLGWASFGNQVETARMLIERGARIDDGELLCAASVGHVEVGSLLIAHGADPEEVLEDAGGNALHAAAAMKYTFDSTRFIQLLIDRGVDVNARTRDGRTALAIAENRERKQREELADAPETDRRNFAGVIDLLRRHGAGH